MLSERVKAINSGDEILARQDEEENIELLKAQRQLYSDAKILHYWYSAISLILPIIAVAVQLLMGPDWTMPVGACIVLELVIILAVCDGLFQKAVKKTELAAEIQQNFDSRVFGVNFERSDVPPKDIERYVTKYDSKGKQTQRLLRWYSSAITGLPSDKAVGLCQKENLQWTQSLSKYYFWPVMAVCLTIIAFTIFLVAVMKMNPANVCFILCPTAWAYREICGYRKYNLALEKMESWGSLEFDTVHNVNEFQKRIFDYRKSSALIPDFLYEKRREVEEKKAAKIIELSLRS